MLGNGSIIESPLFTSLLGCDDLREPGFTFDILGPSWEQRKSHYDGSRDDSSVSSYIVLTPNLDGLGFYGIGMDGRLFTLDKDGTIRTIAGWTARRDIPAFDYLDGTIPMSTVQGQQTLLGNFDIQFNFPTDIA